MRFRKTVRDEPEINLIPFIDVLLVVLIFLMLSTTYNKFTELQVILPVADTEQIRQYPREVFVAISSDGRYAVNQVAVEGRGTEALGNALLAAAAAKDSMIIISADAAATHQSVVSVMEAARRNGLTQITFATQSTGQVGGAQR